MRYLFILFFLPLFGFGQQTDSVDFIKIEAEVTPNTLDKRIYGKVEVSFKTLVQTDSVYLDAVRMHLKDTLKSFQGIEETHNVVMRATEDKIWFVADFHPGVIYRMIFNYEASPTKALYFTDSQIWTQGQGKYTSNWLPSIDDMNDKIEFDLTLIAPMDKSVVANGNLHKFVILDNQIAWKFNMEQPMSSYLVAFAMGSFDMEAVTSKSGVPLEMYLSKKDTLKREPTFRYTREIFDFFETEIGVPYPWQNYKQVPVRDFLYAGMENTTATLFSEAFVVDSIGFNDRNYVNVNAHELAYQWFGNLVTETNGTHHWLHEGFATYFALLAEREIFGNDYYYWKLYNSAEQLRELSEQGNGESLLNPKASSLTFYEKGAWALHILKDLIGEEAFKSAVKNYLEKHQFKNVTTEDFLREVRGTTMVDISDWEQDWLEQTAFKGEPALSSLSKNVFLKRYFELVALRELPIMDKISQLEVVLRSDNEYLGQEAVYQLAGEDEVITEPLYHLAISHENLLVRQAVVSSLSTISDQLAIPCEALLMDDSYVTQEMTLLLLWNSFPEKRAMYLDQLKSSHGFQNKNLRQLWLALAIYTEGYKVSAKPIFIAELQNYSGSGYSYEIREKAFDYIKTLKLFNDEVLHNLVNGSTHHYWRFRNFCRSLLNEVLKNPETKKALLLAKKGYSVKEKEYLDRILK
ncbi:MAG: M1 family metallopeptidase [Bacteroidetes bacterium]|nr:M1 family metallopeptidase [Bacteroidota bacterium]